MASDPHELSRRYFETVRWYLPPLGGEPEPDPVLACTYALLAVYTKLEALSTHPQPTDSAARREPDGPGRVHDRFPTGRTRTGPLRNAHRRRPEWGRSGE